MTQIPDYVRGYRDAFKDVITIIHMRADQMSTPSAKRMVNAVAFQLGEDSKVLERREMFQRLRTYIKETGVLPPHLPEQVVEEFEIAIKDKVLERRMAEGLELQQVISRHLKQALWR